MAESIESVIENMQKVRDAQQGGLPYESVLPESEPPTAETGAYVPPTTAELAYPVSAETAVIMQRPAELAPEDPPPGLTTRGWSPEVTARHPKLVAAAMAELVGEDSAAPAGDLDPLDSAALALLQRDAGFADVVANNLRVEATRLVGSRLIEAMDAASSSNPAIVAARAAAAEEAQAALPEATAPAPAKTTTTAATSTTSKSGSTTSTSGSTSSS